MFSHKVHKQRKPLPGPEVPTNNHSRSNGDLTVQKNFIISYPLAYDITVLTTNYKSNPCPVLLCTGEMTGSGDLVLHVSVRMCRRRTTMTIKLCQLCQLAQTCLHRGHVG